MEDFDYKTNTTIQPSQEFQKKGLADYGVNVGLKCGNGCLYCSSSSVLRTHEAFSELGKSPFEQGYSIVDPEIVKRVASAKKLGKLTGTVMVCTYSDAWAAEARNLKLGRGLLEVILSESKLNVRILTKNAEVMEDFDLIEKFRDRVLVGLSVTGIPEKDDVMHLLEPNSSKNSERLAALEEAHRMGLRTFGMFCPLFPGISDSPEDLEWFVEKAEGFGAEEIFFEPLNARGKAIPDSIDSLDDAGFQDFGDALDQIRGDKWWSKYTQKLLANVQEAMREHSSINKLRFLLYRDHLTARSWLDIVKDDEGVRWLFKEEKKKKKKEKSVSGGPEIQQIEVKEAE